MSDIDIALVDSLKALDPEPPIREADIERTHRLPDRTSIIDAMRIILNPSRQQIQLDHRVAHRVEGLTHRSAGHATGADR